MQRLLARIHLPTDFSCHCVEISCWIFTGERQAAVIRSKYVQILLKQDLGFFDTSSSRGSVVSQVSNDALLVQYVLSEKVKSLVYRDFLYIL